MLAQARETLPPLGTGPGGVAVQPRFDGFRALLFTPLRAGDPVLLQTRRGALVQDRFPDLAAAARSLPAGLVLDGELAVLDHHGQLSFTALQRRATAGRNARVLAAEMPAHFIAFDVLQSDGQELLGEPFARRREVLEALFADHRLGPPWTLCPSTTDPAVAEEWLYEWTDVPGVEGVVVKSLTGRTGQACAAGPRSAAGTPPKHSSAASPARCAAPRSCCWAAMTPPAAYGWWGRPSR
ncbi:hypothetical protein OG379_00310 [Streptomyces sp. NBC_01166]|uniref:ATP-dependent DNA ligase n=1 Tax=Streptomyces sp. NBC_01166 TaxID=2903755 RepID=UPI0038641EEC|nr:hypothetical protein OG379_00310 [Streptomyces sp. NBC_01166]